VSWRNRKLQGAPGAWYYFSWAGGQSYGRAIGKPELASQLEVGDWVEVQTETPDSLYNGTWQVVSLDDDEGNPKWAGKLVGIGLFTDESSAGRVRKVSDPYGDEDSGNEDDTDDSNGLPDVPPPAAPPPAAAPPQIKEGISQNTLILAGVALVGAVVLIKYL